MLGLTGYRWQKAVNEGLELQDKLLDMNYKF